MAKLAGQYKIHPNMIGMWKREALEGTKETFAKGSTPGQAERETEIGELVVQCSISINDQQRICFRAQVAGMGADFWLGLQQDW